MPQAVAAAGLRAVCSVRTADIDEALAFAHTVDGGSVAVKPARSAGPEGVHFCDTADALRRAFEQLLGTQTFFGEANAAVYKTTHGSPWSWTPDCSKPRTTAWACWMRCRSGKPPGHAEIMITPDGPYLVEIGARPLGGAFPQDLYRVCIGHTQIEWSVDSDFDLAAFGRHVNQPCKGWKHPLIKTLMLISTREGELASVPSVNL